MYYDLLVDYMRRIDSRLDSISAPVYYWIIGTTYFIYFISILGITYINPDYTDYLNTCVQIFISIILLIRFNPLRKIKCTPNDRVLIMASALFLLTNDGISFALHNLFKSHTND
jgi:hypothetical protein